MQYKYDADNLGEYDNNAICFARKGHAQEDAEDIERQNWDDGRLYGFFHDGAEFLTGLLQRR